MDRAPKILVFDSGLGGLTVHAEIARVRPGAAFVFAADDAVFPYGALAPNALIERVQTLMGGLVARFAPDIVVIACNTASTLVLPHLRGAYPALPFVGAVPAIKPAAAASRSRRVSVLGTPGTVSRDYTRELMRAHAAHCDVMLVGSARLAPLAEAAMRGEPVADAAIAAEIAPCFVDDGVRRTDHIVLACTHYPLLLPAFERLAPWPVAFVDPAPAIARRVDHVLRERGFVSDGGPGASGVALFTSGAEPSLALREVLTRRALVAVAQVL